MPDASIPQIKQWFDKSLLSTPFLSFCDDSKTLYRIYKYIRSCLRDRHNKKKFEELEKEFLELYERSKIKENELEEKTGSSSKEPLYLFRETNKRKPRLFGILRGASYKVRS